LKRLVVKFVSGDDGLSNVIETAIFDRARPTFGTEQAFALLSELFQFGRGAE